MHSFSDRASAIGSAGTADAFVKYRHPFRDDALLREVEGGPYAPHGYADPRMLKTHFQYDAVVDPPPAVCTCDLASVEVAIDKMRAAILALASEVNTSKAGALAAEAAAAEARDNARALLEKEHQAPPVYTSNRLPVIGTITLRPQP